MLRAFGFIILLSAGLLRAEEVNTGADNSSQVQSRQIVKRGFHPVRALQRLNDAITNGAIHLSSIRIDQPADHMDRVDLSWMPKPLYSENRSPACRNLQLTAVLLPSR